MGGERTSPPVGHCTRVGYQGAGRLSREIFTRLAQGFFRTFHHQDTKAPREPIAANCPILAWRLGVLVVHRAATERPLGALAWRARMSRRLPHVPSGNRRPPRAGACARLPVVSCLVLWSTSCPTYHLSGLASNCTAKWPGIGEPYAVTGG